MLKDEQKKEAAKMKGRPLSEKLDYFLTYNKFAIAAGIIGVLMVSWIVITIATYNPNMLHVIVTDQQGNTLDTSVLDQAWEADRSHSLKTVYTTDMELAFTDRLNNQNVTDMQKVMALYSAKTIDVFLAPEAVFDKYGPEGMFLPLDTVFSSILSKAEWNQLVEDDRIVYAALLDYSGEDPVPSDQVIPVGIRISDSALASTCGMQVDQVCIGVAYNSERPEEALAYLDLFLR